MITILIFCIFAVSGFAVAQPVVESPARPDTVSPAAARTTPEYIIESETAPATATLPSSGTAPAEVPLVDDTFIKNSYVKIVVNANTSDMGRFSLLTVNGDPERATDDNKMLIYGTSAPYTSYTTVWVDGTAYGFGGATQRRPGLSAAYGRVVEPPHAVGNSIVMSCEMGGVLVTQTLTIVNGPISQQPDTMKISYAVENRDTRSHEVGIRVMIDTLLGGNDGAPLRVRDQAVQRETRFMGADVASFWRAFDSLEEPNVISRGTLRGRDILEPDSVWIANWGKLADNPWNDAAYARNASFIRSGEDEPDTAVALKWNPIVLGPGATRSVATLYGLDYLNISGDILRIGTQPHLGEWPTVPGQIRPYTLYAYILNALDYDMDNVVIKLDLPDGVTLTGGDSGVRTFRRLEGGQEVTVGWELTPVAFSGDDAEHKIFIVGTSSQAPEVRVPTKVILLSAPEVDIAIDAPTTVEVKPPHDPSVTPSESLGWDYGLPFTIGIQASNRSASPIDNLRAELILPEGLALTEQYKPLKDPVKLEGHGVFKDWKWRVVPTGEAGGDLTVTVRVTSDSTKEKEQQFTIYVQPLPIRVDWLGVPETAQPGEFLTAEVFAYNLADLNEAAFDVAFDPAVVDVIRVSQGTAFIVDGRASLWSEPKIDNKKGTVTGIRGHRAGMGFTGNGSLATIHFRVRAPGKANIRMSGLEISDTKGRIIPAQPGESNLTITK